MGLEDYKDIVATTASVTTIAQFGSGIFVCMDFVKQGHTGEVPAIQFVLGLVMGCLMMAYALILGDTAMMRVNIVGLTFGVSYVAVYYYYSRQKQQVASLLLKSAAFIASVLIYLQVESEANIPFRFGLIVTGVMIALLVAPFFSLGEIIRTQSTASLPFPMILSGTVVSSQWLLYGIIIKDPFVQLQNVVAFLLCAAQLSLFLIYPRKSKAS